MKEENITLDPEYAELIVEVNKLKDSVAEKIANRDMLAFHIIPDIENTYMTKVGSLENDIFISNMKLLRLNRKVELYKESKRHNIKPKEKEIEEQLDLEFSDIEDEYRDMQEELYLDMEDEITDEMTTEFLKLINIIYKNLIKKLSPLINFNNTRLDNQLYELLEKSYRELDLTMLSKLQIICEQRKNDSTLTIGDIKTLKKAKKAYENLIDENEEIILSIKCSKTYSKKKILDDEKLLEKVKNDLKQENEKIENECKKIEKELEKLINE